MQETLYRDAQRLRTTMASNPAIRVINVRPAAELESECIPRLLIEQLIAASRRSD
jgi:hypothetical protein